MHTAICARAMRQRRCGRWRHLGHEIDPLIVQWTTLARYRTLGLAHVPCAAFHLGAHRASTTADHSGSARGLTLARPLGAVLARLRLPIAAADADTPPASVFRATKELLALESSGYSTAPMAARAELRHIDSRLFKHYMTRREV